MRSGKRAASSSGDVANCSTMTDVAASNGLSCKKACGVHLRERRPSNHADLLACPAYLLFDPVRQHFVFRSDFLHRQAGIHI